MAEHDIEHADIVLVGLNAKYIHASLGIRYLYANLGPLQERARLLESTLKEPTRDLTERILTWRPRVVGFGVYIWNVLEVESALVELRKRAPDVVVVLGGPEISYEWEGRSICERADYIITGEADQAFATLCASILSGAPPSTKTLRAAPPDLERLESPYAHYSADDLKHRVLYVEASRGCPFTCEFCLSSLDQAVRRFPLEALLAEFDDLLRRGARQFKFVDRTFNLHTATGVAILRFFLERYRPGLFLHFEMVPDRLPEALREWIAPFPQGALQFEVGLQSLNEAVSARIRRRQDLGKVEDNLRFLLKETGVYIHADLILGLPGEDLDSFGAGFDRLFSWGPHEIQLGILKRLKGTPIVRHESEFAMRFQEAPPYEILSHRDLTADELADGRRMAKFWDRMVNSGRFAATIPWVWKAEDSVFWAFWRFSQWLFRRFERTHAIPWEELARALFDYLVAARPADRGAIATDLWRDLEAGGFAHAPRYLGLRETERLPQPQPSVSIAGGKRQELRFQREASSSRDSKCE